MERDEYDKALAAAQALLEERAARAPLMGEPDRETLLARAAEAQELQAFARGEFKAAGFAVERLENLAAERNRARQAQVATAEKRAIAASRATADRLAALTPAPPAPINRSLEIIDRVTFIRSFAGQGAVFDQNIGAFDSWARYELSGPNETFIHRGLGRLGFFTLWRNPFDQPLAVAAGARLVANARLSAHTDGAGPSAWLGWHDEARATARARITVSSLSGNLSAIVFERPLASVQASTGFFDDDQSATIAFNEFLQGSGMLVPARAFILIEVELQTEWFELIGKVRLDAQSGAFRIEVPHLILTLS